MKALHIARHWCCCFRPRLIALLALLVAGSAHAFPPAPYYTIFGQVRDQVGQTIKAEGAVLILLKGGVEIGRTPITSGLHLDKNYDLPMRLDQVRAGTQPYSSKAIASDGPYSLVVEMNGALFYPIEVAGNLTAGKGGERVRLDLNLGEDSDGDGLPDVWEQWMLYQAGISPDEQGNWPLHLIDRNGDFDGDGASNWLEYVAGTFAGDATERFALSIKEKAEATVRFEFFAITGKTYTIERSSDMVTWTRVPFSVGSPGVGEVSFQAADVGIVSAHATPTTAAKELYRLTVR